MTYAIPLRIQIKKEDINNGKRGHTTQCPIALAIGRRIPAVVKVHGCHVEILESDGIGLDVWADLPQKAIDWIFQFDHSPRGRPKVKPFRFTLALTRPYHAMS